ncbi:hypothetical protein DFH06DRAFT_1122312 [Mycena polygramma]|nr:hypothetical protein DFH06DRAFT_1122312 [Mycena polygramma]
MYQPTLRARHIPKMECAGLGTCRITASPHHRRTALSSHLLSFLPPPPRNEAVQRWLPLPSTHVKMSDNDAKHAPADRQRVIDIVSARQLVHSDAQSTEVENYQGTVTAIVQLFLRPAYAVLGPTHPAIVCSVVVDHYKTSPLDVVSGVLHDTGVPHLAADIGFKRVQEGMDDREAVIWYKGTPVSLNCRVGDSTF